LPVGYIFYIGVVQGLVGVVTVFSPLGGVLASHHPGEAQVPKELVGDSLDFRDQRRADAPMVRQSVGGGRPRTLVRGTDQRVDSLFPVRRMEGATTRGFISYAAGGGRIAIGDGKRYAILVYDASGRFIGIAGRSLPVQVPTAEQAVAESLSMLNQPSISPARRASRMREYRERPVSYFREIRFDDHRRLWVFRPERDGVVADVYADTTLLGSIPLACPGFEPAGVGMRYGWVVLSCRNLDPDAPSDGTFRLFRVEG
jgi:hypothetical protein